jgi:hypothetical protein
LVWCQAEGVALATVIFGVCLCEVGECFRIESATCLDLQYVWRILAIDAGLVAVSSFPIILPLGATLRIEATNRERSRRYVACFTIASLACSGERHRETDSFFSSG